MTLPHQTHASDFASDEEVTRIYAASEPPPPPWQVWVPGSAQRDEYSRTELRARLADGRLPQDALVWPPEGDAWLKASEVPELRSTGSLPLPSLPPPPVAAASPSTTGQFPAASRNQYPTTPPSRSPSERARALARANVVDVARRSYRAGADFVENVIEQVPFEKMSTGPRGLWVAGGASFFVVLTTVLLLQVWSLKAEVTTLREEVSGNTSSPEAVRQGTVQAASPAPAPAPEVEPQRAELVVATAPAKPAPTPTTELPAAEAEGDAPVANDPKPAAAPKTQARAPARHATRAPTAKKKASAPSEPQKAVFTGPFDFGKAKAALVSAAGRASGCGKEEATGSGAVMVTFATSGRIANVTILTPKFQTGATAGCIRSAFSAARIPPFSGAAKAVKKSFTIQ